MKEFNVTGICIPGEHYMVDTSEKLDQIIQLVDKGKYFTMNRARQYGKTTILAALESRLADRYRVLRLSFEGLGEESFSDSESFLYAFVSLVADGMEYGGFSRDVIDEWRNMESYQLAFKMDAFDFLGKKITKLCGLSEQNIVMMVDEVDKSSDNQVFLNFLGMLRNKYLKSREKRDYTFYSVILAGVYDIKNMKLKIRPDAEQKYNSPWNIAADFSVDMSFSVMEIATMLEDYETEHHTGMDIPAISAELFFYTSGYPYLVSRLCKWIDEEGGKIWTRESVREAEKALLKTRDTLFDDLIKNVENHAELKKMIIHLLYYGASLSFSLSNSVISLGVMFGILAEKDHMVAISNLIFETYLYDYTISDRSLKEHFEGPERNQFIKNGRLDMPLILEKFQELMKAEYRPEDEKFLEQQGRLLFLCFLKPIINGNGFYYVEPETRNSTRMDIVVAYGGEEHIIELKLWRGEGYRDQGIRQLEDYLDSRNTDRGYLVSFSFLKNKNYTRRWISQDQTTRRIFEIIV